MTILAWHNDPQLKADTVAAMIADREADAIIKGVYQLLDPDKARGYRGCAIGCLIAAKRDPRQHQEDPSDATNPWVIEPDRDGDHGPAGVARVWAGLRSQSWHGEAARLYGIPWQLAVCIDDLFESLPDEDNFHARFAVEVIEAIPVGADLSNVVLQRNWDRDDSSTEDAAELIRLLKAAPIPAVTDA
jgi:hypothetical protein